MGSGGRCRATLTRGGHFAAMPYAEVPKFLRALRGSTMDKTTKLAFEFLILTAARTGEVLGMRLNEVELGAAIWTIPAVRTKTRREHRVPLAPRAVEIIGPRSRPTAQGMSRTHMTRRSLVDVRFAPESRHCSSPLACPLSADCVAKVTA
jgi:integrase